jgi:hypothetical protein
MENEIEIGEGNVFGCVLFNDAPFFRSFDKTRRRDASSWPFIVEELIAFGATDIAIPQISLALYAMDVLPDSLRKRIRVIDKKRATLESSNLFFSPIAEDYGFKVGAWSLFSPLRGEIPDILELAVVDLYFNMYAFFLGLEYQLEIDINIKSMKQNTKVLRAKARDPESRKRLAVLTGILNCYSSKSVDSIVLKPDTNVRLVELFSEFVQDETYRQISRSFHELGYPARLKRSLTIIKRLARKLVTQAPFKQVIDVSSRIIAAASRLPVPDSKLGASLVQKKYLPPIVPVRQAVGRAREAWEKADTSFIPLR